jgi:hypothetical protein
MFVFQLLYRCLPTPRGIQSAIFPEEEVNFKYGDTPVFLRQTALTHMEGQMEDEADEPPTWRLAAIAPKIHKMVTDTYLFVWESYREVLVAAGFTLADRLRDEYNTTALKISRAHRSAVARRRATAIAEQEAADQAPELEPD